MTATTELAPSEVPEINTVTVTMLKAALKAGWGDFIAYPLFGLFFGGVYVAGGMLIWWLTRLTGETYWMVIL